MNQKEAVKKYFDTVSSDYEKAYECGSDDPLRTHIFNERKKIVLDFIDRTGGRALDVGCGPAVMTKALLEKKFIVYHSDISGAMIEKAKAAFGGQEFKGRVFFETSDAEHLDFEDSFFDVVVCIGVIEYLADYHKAIATIAKILKKGGSVIISIPNKGSILNGIDDLLGTIAFTLLPKSFDSQKSIRCSGFKTKRCAPSQFIKDLERYGLVKEAVKFHGYRLVSLRRFFPALWIFLSNALAKIDSFLPVSLLANNCVIKFRKIYSATPSHINGSQ